MCLGLTERRLCVFVFVCVCVGGGKGGGANVEHGEKTQRNVFLRTQDFDVWCGVVGGWGWGGDIDLEFTYMCA